MNDTIPDNHHVVRYCTPMNVENGLPKSTAFSIKNHPYLSVNWLEYFNQNNFASAVQCVRSELKNNLKLSKNGLFVKLHIATAKKIIFDKHNHSLSFKKKPYPNSPSHAGVFGYNSIVVEIELANMIKANDTFPGV